MRKSGLAMQIDHSVEQVFTPTSPAQVNFVDRKQVTNQLVDALRTPGKQIVVYGESGSGKSTLLLNKLRQVYAAHVTSRCSAHMTYEKLLLDAFDQLDPFYIAGRSSRKDRSLSPSIQADFLRLRASVDASLSKSTTLAEDRVLPPQLTVQRLARFLGEQGMCWVVEDFHKMPVSEKLPLAQSMKIFSDMSDIYPAVKTVIIGATETARQVVEYDPDMTRRVSELLVPLMTTEELAEIILNGQALLNVDLSPIAADIVNYSVGIPSVCHQLALNSCLEKGISVRARSRLMLTRDDLRPALDRYVNESSDTIKANFGKALKHRAAARLDHRRIILGAMASGPLAGMRIPDILAKVRLVKNGYTESNLRRYLKELSDEGDKERLLRLGRDGKYRFVEPVYHTVALATLMGPRTPKHARPNRYVEDIIAAAWLNVAMSDAMWDLAKAEPGDIRVEEEEELPSNGDPTADLGEKARWSTEELELLKDRFMVLHSMSNDEARGPLFVQFLDDLLELFEIHSELAYQPDENHVIGSAKFDGAEYEFRATWGNSSTNKTQVEEFGSGVRDQGRGLPGWFFSINGFPDEAVDAARGFPIIGIDGSDIFLVLDQRIRLDELLRHKIQAADEAGNSFVSARDMVVE
jgi:hypothetical protein